MSITRRRLLSLTPVAFLPLSLHSRLDVVAGPSSRPPQSPGASGSPGATAPGPQFPGHPAEIVREVVIASHGNVARVKELVTKTPALSRAAIDWGYGDWEDALGAASHVGNREIAEFLIANGARPSIFSAAMLGQLDAVKAVIAAMPGCESIHGPHSITLLKHAMAGGAAAQPVVDFLKTLPGADSKPATQPLSPEEIATLSGTYVFGSSASDRLVVAASNAGMTSSGWALTITRPDTSPRGLAHLGDRAFYPTGAVHARVRFSETDGTFSLSVFDPNLLVTARKIR